MGDEPGSSRVPLVLHVIPTAVARGAQREARALADHLDRPGVRHHRVLSLFSSSGEVTVDLSLDHRGGRETARGMDPRLVMRLRSYLRRLDPSVVIAHGGDSLKYLVPAVWGRSWPLVYYATGTFARAGDRARVALWGVLVHRADVVAAEGEEVQAECSRLWRVPDERLVLAPNGRDPEEFHPADDGSEHGSTPVVAFVGALNEGKRPGLFIEVVDRLRRRGGAFRAVACGDGPLAQVLATPAARAEVEMLGTQSDVASILRDADVFLFTSLPTGEGMPGVLIEAGLSGLPVVATKVPGVAMIVEHGTTGYVVEPDDLESLAESTERLLADSDLRRRMGEAARTRCKARFSIDAVVDCWSSFVEPLVARSVAERDGRSGRDDPPAREA